MDASVPDYAGLDRRAMAFAIDIFFLYLVILLVQTGLYTLTAGWPFRWLTTGPQIEGWILLTVSLPTWLYFALSERSSRSATFGKRALKLQVTSLGGERISFSRSLLRTLVKLLPWELTHLTIWLPVPWMWDPSPGFRFGLILVYLLLGCYMATMIFSERKQGPHDFLARTVVIRGA